MAEPSSKTIVIKFGGHAMDQPDLLLAFMDDLHQLVDQGHKFVLVHGGGPHINRLLQRLQIESHFEDGLRVTDEKVLEVVEMALAARVNKELTRSLQKIGLKAVGLSGQDGGMLQAESISEKLGRVGKIRKVDPAVLNCLLASDFLPVVAPLGVDANYDGLNINADTSAGAIAGQLEADYFILISDVPGVLDKQSHLLEKLDSAAIRSLLADGTISGGMIPKTECCLAALEKGCKKALILDGRRKNSLKLFIEKGEPVGTLISL